MISINNLKKSYGAIVATDIAHLEFRPGEIIGLVGNNGAGKTTMFSLILDLIKAQEGNVTSFDIQVDKSENWKKHTGAYISESFVIDFLTPEEYFEFVADLHNWDRSTLYEFLEKFDTLFNGEILKQKKYIRDLSKGNQKKTGIAGAFIGDPQVVILDEPFANLDPTSQARLKSIISELHDEKKIFLVSSHDLTHVAEVSSRIIVMNKGEIVKDEAKNEDTLDSLRTYFDI